MKWKVIAIGAVSVPLLSVALGEVIQDDIGEYLWFFILLSTCAVFISSYHLNSRHFLHGFIAGVMGSLFGSVILLAEPVFRPATCGFEEMAIPLMLVFAIPIAICVGIGHWLAGLTWKYFKSGEPQTPNVNGPEIK